jgi:uncharacterized membrane protein YdcZ (DUF606 family)
MAVPQKPAQEVIFEETAPAAAAHEAAPPKPPPPSAIPEAGFSDWLKLTARLGLIVTIVSGFIACFTYAIEAIAQRDWESLVQSPVEILALFVIIGILGYICSGGGMRRLAQLAGEVRDRTLPPALALVSLMVGLVFLSFTIDSLLNDSYAPAVSLLGMCISFVLIALIWFRPAHVGTTIRDEQGPGKWPFLETILALIELGGKVSSVGGIILFGVGGAFASLGLLISLITAIGERHDATAAVRVYLYDVGMLGVAPLFGYLALLAAYGLAHTIRVFVATEGNTRKPAGQ